MNLEVEKNAFECSCFLERVNSQTRAINTENKISDMPKGNESLLFPSLQWLKNVLNTL